MKNINLKIERMKKGLTQKDIAEKNGISKSYLADLENGYAKNPSLTTMQTLANFYDCTLDYLFADNQKEISKSEV